MKLTMNSHVRATIQGELQDACDRYDRALQNNDGNIDARIEINASKEAIVSAAAKILSHASRGKRYPLMTQSTWQRI